MRPSVFENRGFRYLFNAAVLLSGEKRSEEPRPHLHLQPSSEKIIHGGSLFRVNILPPHSMC